MAFTKTLPQEVLNSIADDLGARFEPSDDHMHFRALNGRPLPRHGLNLGETFEVWRLIPDAIREIASGNTDIALLTRRSGLWHHQLRSGGEPVGFARSKPLGPDPGSWSVRDIFTSEVAAKIDEAIAWVDEKVSDDVEVRLLSIPSQQVEAFWFVTDSDDHEQWNNTLLVLRAPERMPELEFLKLVNSEEFLKSLDTPERGRGIKTR